MCARPRAFRVELESPLSGSVSRIVALAMSDPPQRRSERLGAKNILDDLTPSVDALDLASTRRAAEQDARPAQPADAALGTLANLNPSANIIPADPLISATQAEMDTYSADPRAPDTHARRRGAGRAAGRSRSRSAGERDLARCIR